MQHRRLFFQGMATSLSPIVCRHLAYTIDYYKKLSCRRETARRFVSLNILLIHARLFEMTLLNRACVSLYWYLIETMSGSRTVSEIFSVKEWRELETGIVAVNH